MRLSATRLTSAAQPGGRTPIQRAIAIFRRFGVDAHIYLPGVGMINGLQAGNYLDSAGTTQGTVDQPVGLVLDAAGSLGVELVTLPTINSVSVGGAAFTNYATGASVVAGKTYSIKYTVSGYAGSDNVGYAGSVFNGQTAPTANGTYTHTLTASGSGAVELFSRASNQCVFTGISVREVTGIHAQQPTTASKPILRKGAVAVSQYSGDLTGWQTTAAATITGGQVDPFGGTTAKLMSGAGKNVYFTALKSGSILAGETVTQLIHCYSATAGTVLVGSPSAGPTSFINVASGWGVYAFTWTAVANDGPSIILSGTLAAITVYRSALFRGTYTAAQIQALGGIPLTTTAPASTALGPHWWDTTGGKTLVATFPAGNESVTVIDTKSTGQVTLTGQNVVGAYSISTPTNGRIIVNGAMTAPELTLLQSYANKMAGL